jgi:hypothetical protein
MVKGKIVRAHGILKSSIEQVDILGPRAYTSQGMALARVTIAMETSAFNQRLWSGGQKKLTEVGAKPTPGEQPSSRSLA